MTPSATLLASVALACASTLLALIATDLAVSRFRFWPPATRGNWADKTFIWLFRGMFLPVVAASALTMWQNGLTTAGRVGLAVLILGFGLALFSTFWMGWRTAFGDMDDLATTGPFRFSRHPVYVATWIGLAGWGLVVGPNAPLILATLGCWGIAYLAAIFLEEPEMHTRFGSAYSEYCRRTPRFLGVPHGTQALS